MSETRLYKVYGISDDYVGISDSNIERRYPFDWNSHGTIVVTFEDSVVHLELRWQYVDVSRHYLSFSDGEAVAPTYKWAVTLILTRGLGHLGVSPRGTPMVEVGCDVPPLIVTSPLGNAWTFPEGEER